MHRVHKVHRVHRCWGAVCLVLALAGRAFGQDVDALIKTGDAHLAAYRYNEALQQYVQIPDRSTLDQQLDKHIGIAMALMGVGKFTDVNEHVTTAVALATQIGTDSAMARAKNTEGQLLRGTKTGDRGIASLHDAARLAERAGNRRA